MLEIKCYIILSVAGINWLLIKLQLICHMNVSSLLVIITADRSEGLLISVFNYIQDYTIMINTKI